MGFAISLLYDGGFIQLMNCALNNLIIRHLACSFGKFANLINSSPIVVYSLADSARTRTRF